ncbi:13219_t:CDS:2 [Cetraspora pellucida]|uniref:13219_t:CDS:1 n=1 Tax=Cetraspora pellucida TaxID=1433469 RepID=A0A9N9I0M7_9GLOM|nr:13219_t:CDS:2 [Cetraspora pellucida]
MTRSNFIEIPFKELTTIKTLNLPELGIFKTATLKWSNKPQTVAMILVENNVDDIQKLQDIQHKNIIKFYGITYDLENSKYVVFQFAADGNLRDYLVRNKTSTRAKLKMAKGIAKGLEYLHKKGIVHENLSPSTIFVENKNALIANPTVSTVTKKDSSVNTMRNMIPYLDPQSFKNPQHRLDFKSNIYSLGIIMWQIFSCKEPLSNYSNLMAFVHDILSNKREEPFGDAPDEYISLYKDCWSSDPDKRPSIQQVVSRLMKISV